MKKNHVLLRNANEKEKERLLALAWSCVCLERMKEKRHFHD